MNVDQEHGANPRAEAGAWHRRVVIASLLAATVGTGVLVGAAAFGSGSTDGQRGPVSPVPATHTTTIDPVPSCFGSRKEMHRWVEHGVGDPQQCIISRASNGGTRQ